MFDRFAIAGLLAAGSLVPFAAHAVGEHDHAGDVAVSAVGGQLVLGGGFQTTASGHKLYEAEFGDQFVYYQTSNPGFQTQDGAALLPGTFLSFAGVGALGFWNGTAWGTAAAGDYVSIRDAAGQDTQWTGSGVAAGASSYIARVDAGGGVHAHVPFSTNPLGTEGAYLIQLQLTSPDYASSTPFYIAFNYGLSHEDFELAVDSLVTAVPEPGTYALMLLGLGAVGMAARRRSAR
ncbi:PEP-CTERM sorting domain-containing protein [Aquincola sp. MAHUQ-54]|uniref:PEP-CTERM sorting domain-containing protein n=1 Tax=Aquincola agrisoli TaxID=3119538 RepID=A0AAW9Q9C9_9BURK